MDPKNVEEMWSSEDVMKELTGLGNTHDCTLCASFIRGWCINGQVCKDCTWVKKTINICCEGENKRTYDAFTELEINDEEDLVAACKARADYMRNVINWFEEELY